MLNAVEYKHFVNWLLVSKVMKRSTCSRCLLTEDEVLMS